VPARQVFSSGSRRCTISRKKKSGREMAAAFTQEKI
jgi:hypothetical protein